eukprot:4582194-Lingulodinium_polyedra.AAC.1
MGALVCIPPRLLEAKGGWDVLGASLVHAWPRHHAPQAIIVNIYLQDGLHAVSFGRRQQARHELYYDVAAADGEEALLAGRLRDWVLPMRCMLHVASSSLKWGLSRWCSESVLDDTHMVIKSCINSSGALQNHVAARVVRHV